ncbi:conserved hypothetical protein [Methylocella tundrae]|uniref:Uncharacterized protein n=1 Tax=Methylocella tundrae TaxID=227605 RepID=A0A8B6MD20_METTU|nr:hypothetical protein [Methylocella tundrae]VTZ26747.1 conserved hypothetical protein [Methylocella tundrae]VTZ52258.1 conserved hypothetical protein [Methylocella tundrae]
MIRLTLQFIGLFILASAFAALAIDSSRSFAAGHVILTELGDTAAALAPNKAEALRVAINGHWPALLERSLTKVAQLPTFLGLGLIGALMFWLARKPQPKIGYSSR